MRNVISLSLFGLLILNFPIYGTAPMNVGSDLIQKEQPPTPQPPEATPPSALISPEPGGPPESGSTSDPETGQVTILSSPIGLPEGRVLALLDLEIQTPHIARGELRYIDRSFNIISVKGRFFTRHYVGTPEAIESAIHIGINKPVKISYIISHGIRCAVEVTAELDRKH